MNTNITRAKIEHASTIADFNQMMAMETEDKVLATDTIQAGVRNMIENTDLGFYLLAEVDDQVVGCLGITFEWSDWRNGLFWWIQSVYVLPDFRDHGVFSTMYDHVKRLAKEDDRACGIRLYVEKDNTRAYNTYVRLGMIETEYRLMEEEFSAN